MDMDATTLWLIRLIVDLLVVAALGWLVLRIVQRRLTALTAAAIAKAAEQDAALIAVRDAALARAAEQDAVVMTLSNKTHALELAQAQTQRELVSLQQKSDTHTELLRQIQATLQQQYTVSMELGRYFLPQVFARPGMQFNGPATITGPAIGGDVGTLGPPGPGGNGAPEGRE